MVALVLGLLFDTAAAGGTHITAVAVEDRCAEIASHIGFLQNVRVSCHDATMDHWGDLVCMGPAYRQCDPRARDQDFRVLTAQYSRMEKRSFEYDILPTLTPLENARGAAAAFSAVEGVGEFQVDEAVDGVIHFRRSSAGVLDKVIDLPAGRFTPWQRAAQISERASALSPAKFRVEVEDCPSDIPVRADYPGGEIVAWQALDDLLSKQPGCHAWTQHSPHGGTVSVIFSQAVGSGLQFGKVDPRPFSIQEMEVLP